MSTTPPLSLPLLVLTCKCPPLLLLQPLTPTPTADKTMHTDSLVISKSPPAPNLRLHNTENQIQIQLLLLLIPRKIVPTPEGVNQLRTIESFQTVWFHFFCCFLIEIALFSLRPPIGCLLPILSHFLWPLDVPPFPHCEPLGPIKCATNTNTRQQMSPLWATWQYHQWTAKKKGVTLHFNAY